MITNAINLVELIADEGKMLVDKDRTSTFKKIMVRQDKISDYQEITLEEAEEIEKLINNSEEVE